MHFVRLSVDQCTWWYRSRDSASRSTVYAALTLASWPGSPRSACGTKEMACR